MHLPSHGKRHHSNDIDKVPDKSGSTQQLITCDLESPAQLKYLPLALVPTQRVIAQNIWVLTAAKIRLLCINSVGDLTAELR